MRISQNVTPKTLRRRVEKMFEISAGKIRRVEKTWASAGGAPVFTVRGKYTSRGWTDWTQGFQVGAAILQFDATGEREFLAMGRSGTFERMAAHVSHTGVHDHGFNNVSTYGALWRLMGEKKVPFNPEEKHFYEMALKVSGAVQASRWTTLPNGGFIYSFNGPHSLFVDTIRSLRSLAIAHLLGHVLMGERDSRISLLERLVLHGLETAKNSVYYGQGRDIYDVRGRTAHESIYNVHDGSYRCPSSQQGYSPFTTWTRGLAWAILGFAEQIEFLDFLLGCGGGGVGLNRSLLVAVRVTFLKAAEATADFYIENSCADGIPLWDTGAGNAWRLGNYLSKASDPFNGWEPVDSSAAAIAAQGLIRLGNVLLKEGAGARGRRYRAAGFTIARTLLGEPYLCMDARHEGLLLHSIYHRPNGWDRIQRGQKVPNGESSMWGDYHLRELGLLLLREARGETYPVFFRRSGGEC